MGANCTKDVGATSIDSTSNAHSDGRNGAARSAPSGGIVVPSSASQQQSSTRSALLRRISSRTSQRASSGTTSHKKKRNCLKHTISCLFPEFTLLSDDIVLCILSFVADAPFEEKHDDAAAHERLVQDYVGKPPQLSPFRELSYYQNGGNNNRGSNASLRFLAKTNPERFGTLIHILPLVCKRFYKLCYGSDVLWGEVLMRLAVHNDSWFHNDVWGVAGKRRLLKRLSASSAKESDVAVADIEEQKSPTSIGSLEEDVTLENETSSSLANEERQLIQELCQIVKDGKQQDQQLCQPMLDNLTMVNSSSVSSAYMVYRLLVQDKLRTFTAPVFFMRRDNVQLHHSISLHLFEPRYRLLIQQVMKHRGRRDTTGLPITAEPKPRFIYCADSALEPGRRAFIVEVLRCRILPDGRANVLLVPVTNVILVNVKQLPGCHGLREGAVRRDED